jgi:hypothetical protein
VTVGVDVDVNVGVRSNVALSTASPKDRRSDSPGSQVIILWTEHSDDDGYGD